MSVLSRRQLAEYAANQLLDGQSAKKLAAGLAAVLVETRRTHEAEFLVQDITWELERRGKLAQAQVTSATPLTNDLRKELEKLIKIKAQVERVSLEENVDKSVLGGMRIDTAIHNWDKTIAKQLTDIREAF